MKAFVTPRWILHMLALFAALSLLSGCATVHEMGVDRNTKTLNLNGKGLVLMSLKVSDHYKPEYLPKILVTFVETPDADAKEDRHNFKTDVDGTSTGSDGTVYLLRMELPPGKYVVRGALGMYQSLFINATCQVPIHTDIEVRANTVTYIGRVSAVMRERHGDEFRAGPVIPLVDQGVSGYANSTFDVVISDAGKDDLISYRALFPALTTADIKTDIAPPFDRARAQAWWESDGRSETASAKAPSKDPKPAI